MELKISLDYEELANEWQYRLITLLKQKMEHFNIEEETAKEIVGEFVFDLSMLHDHEAITVNGNSYNPRICFDDFDGNLITSDVETNLHEFAFDRTGEAYDD
jgi:hypothetical protein